MLYMTAKVLSKAFSFFLFFFNIEVLRCFAVMMYIMKMMGLVVFQNVKG